MQSRFQLSREQVPVILVTALFALFVVMLPRYTDTAKTWYALLILGATVFLACNWRELARTNRLERLFFAVLILNFAWIAFCYYANGEPGRGASFVWGRHFYLPFLIPLFFLFRRYSISDGTIVLILVCSVVVSLADISIDLFREADHRQQGMNPNKFGPIQLCLSGMLFFYVLKLPSGTWRRLALAGLVIGLPTVILSLSRTTWVTLAALSVFFVFYLGHRTLPVGKKLLLASAILVLIAGSYAVPMVKDRVDKASLHFSEYIASDDYRDIARETPIGTRVELWKTGWKIFLENPLSGVGVGGFRLMAKENWERYQVNPKVRRFKYVHNQYIAALATRGFPGLLLFLLLMTLPLYIAMTHRAPDHKSEVARLSLMFICLTYLIGCLTEDHFEGKSATMFVSVFVALLLARLSPGDSGQPRARPK
jgi:O-antigen ligase